ncbi:hypothetical protein JS562_25010, partial [Agrobacterium sp. S2]|nr:hypothetical protein [Agrobacterium sp. S2]
SPLNMPSKLIPVGKRNRPTAAVAVNENPVLPLPDSAIFGACCLWSLAGSVVAGNLENRRDTPHPFTVT